MLSTAMPSTATDNGFVAGAVSAGAKRLVAQSIAFAYAPGPLPYVEVAPLDLATATVVAKLEQPVSGSGLHAIVLSKKTVPSSAPRRARG